MPKCKPEILVFTQAMILLLHIALNEGCSTVCQGGTIHSPNYPQEYTNNLNLNWTLTAPAGQHILVNITDVTSECGYDYLTIFDGNDTLGPQLLQFCTLGKDRLFASSSNSLYIIFQSDSTVVAKGFSLTYSCFGCERHLLNAAGEIKSPLFPENYVNNAQCSWLIEGHEGEIIFLYIPEVHTECGYDYVSVHDGDSKEDPLLFRECLSHGASLASTSHFMYINFSSDSTVTGKGFSGSYYFFTGCGATLKDPVGAFTSPGYPFGYSDNLRCSWTIVAEEDSVIILTFASLNVECFYDNVRVYDGENTQALLVAELCNEFNYTLTSTSNHLHITFITDWSVTFEGFSATYYTACNNVGK